MAKILESWCYGNPANIADRLIDASKRRAKKEDQERRKKARKIRKFVQAKMKGL